MGVSWEPLGSVLGASWGRLGASWGPLGAPLGSFRGGLGAILEEINQSRGFPNYGPPLGSSKNRLLDPSCGALGALLGVMKAVSGLSWASLGALLGQLGAILRPRKAIGSEKARRQKTLIFLRFWKDFSLLGGLLGRLGGLLEPSWSGLGASWSILEAILSQLGLS